MLSALTPPHTHTHKHTSDTRKLKGIGNVYYLDCSNGITGVCICLNSSNRTQKISAVFVYELCLNTVF